METRNYPVSQTVTAIVLALMWGSCRANRLKFAGFKAKYTDAFIDARLAEIAAAEALPSEEARALPHIRLHDELKTLGKEGRQLWQGLKLYIADTTENPEQEWAAAGQAEYAQAANNKFPALKELLQKGSSYIENNTTALLANDNMPATFPDIYNEKMEQVIEKMNAFYAEEEASRVATAQKVDKFNICYKAGISMGADGQHLYSDDEEMRKQFSFEAVTNIVSPPGAASVSVKATFNGMPKAGAEITIEGTDKSGITNIHGQTLITQLQQGPAVCKVVCDGCEDQFVNVMLSAGTTTRIDVVLEPLFEGTMTVGAEANTPQNDVVPAPANS